MVTTRAYSEPTIGILTVGTGVASQSAVNSGGNLVASQFIAPNGVAATNELIEAAFARSLHVHLLPGLYPPFQAAVTLPDGAVLTASPGAILQPATSGSVLMFSGAGRARLSGFQVLISTWVASAKVMSFTVGSKDVLIQDVLFDCETHTQGGNAVLQALGYITNATPGVVTGSTSTPMVLIDFNRTLRKTVERCTFLPCWAITCIKSTSGNGYSFRHNHFTNDLEAGIGGTQIAVPRLAYRLIDVEGDEWGSIFDNRCWAIGDPEVSGVAFFTGGPRLLDAVFRLNGSAATTVDENGHSHIQANRIELCASKKAIRIQGYVSTTVLGNLMGYGGNVSTSLGEAGIVLDCRDGDTGAPVTADLASDVTIVGNDLHNISNFLDVSPTKPDEAGSFIHLQYCDSPMISGNRFGIVLSWWAITIGSASVRRAHIVNNAFRGGAGTPESPIAIIGANNLPDGIFVANNSREAFATASPFVYDESNASATGRRKILTGIAVAATGAENGSGLTTNITLDQP